MDYREVLGQWSYPVWCCNGFILCICQNPRNWIARRVNPNANYRLQFMIIFFHDCNKVVMSVTQSRSTLCYPMDCRPAGSSVHGILQARILEWVAMPSSRGSSRPRDLNRISCTAGRFFTVWASREVLITGGWRVRGGSWGRSAVCFLLKCKPTSAPKYKGFV